jgi:hypothetical protein
MLPKHSHNFQNSHKLQNPYIHTPKHYKTHTYTHPRITKQVKTTTVQDGARGGVVVKARRYKTGRSRVRFPMVTLEFFIDILSVALWPWGRLSL